MGGLWKYMPITATCCLVGTLSISGWAFPPLSGFFSKDEIIGAAWKFNVWLGALMIFTALLTAFYMFRLFFMTFHNEYRGSAKPHESPPVMTLPLVALAVPSILSGYLGFNPIAWDGLKFNGATGAAGPTHFGSFIYFGHAPEFEGVNGLVMGLSIAASLIGVFAAASIYLTRSWRINEAIAGSRNFLVKFGYQASFNKWGFDDFYFWLVRDVVVPAFNLIWVWIDKYVVDNLVDLTALVTVGFGEFLRYWQNGRGQYYALVIFAWVAGLTVFAFLFRP
jgi:NADH:ubiquinone oxidoreductase subunit 5 (subunit L)/multisubunit Na+/H+ antiporter MnhA subunit